MTAETASTSRVLPPVDRAPLRRRKWRRAGVQAACVAITLFMALPLVFIALAAFSGRAALNEFPKSLVPSEFAVDTMTSFLAGTGTVPALGNSLLVGCYTVVLSLLFGAPAGYALARHTFRGKDAYQLFVLLVRALPIVVLSVPLATMFLNFGIYDKVVSVTLVHTALAMPTTVLITASIFVSVPTDVEEAARVFGCTKLDAVRRTVLPLALPGLAAASIFTFVLSWNEVLGAAVLTLGHRTLPAQVLASLAESPQAYRFAGGFALVVPALVFIAVMRRYLLNMWGSTLR
ncbi:carbohydrate ABC transporter membrane protein 2 (CUT1 family) [Tamaricihabitans halophyticus]|uniref:Carbohydrate ABC transporter membrane protein 2 (CUT1 family) n=1 Tax=Tamaricihabitans halophyticus TaxID=1262583 RepID=A0A4R2QYC2_9PSEU|nr:carbohydrate ABC transporter permease [Tamaricihabitans halophyticus]TCP55232.1 carbohydrate ABC transporter membrane protein 2 (CUT1 family) [Tamaricihabitans halophyticus]